MRQQNGRQAVLDADGRLLQVEERHQTQIEPAVRTYQGIEAGRHHHGRQDERQRGSHPQEAFAAELKAAEQKGRRHAQHQGQQSGKGGLVKGETGRAAHQSPVPAGQTVLAPF